MRSYLDFEKPVAEIEAKLEELRALEAGDSAAAIGEEITRLEVKAALTLRDIYASLTPWQKTQVARHPDRPHCLDYVAALITDFAPLAGRRRLDPLARYRQGAGSGDRDEDHRPGHDSIWRHRPDRDRADRGRPSRPRRRDRFRRERHRGRV